MKRYFATVITICLLLSCVACADTTGEMQDVFWPNLRYSGETVDFTLPSPNCTEGSTSLCNEYNPYVHQECWKAYWYETSAMLDWFGIEFCAAEKPMNYSDWVHWDCHYTEVWGDWFNEMYYEGGAENPLADEKYDAFWKGLRLNDVPFDPFDAPPNYDASMDFYAGERSEIGYHWYWEYYICGECWNWSIKQIMSDEPLVPEYVLEWKGIGLDTSASSENYRMEEDAYPYNRMNRDYLQFWADHFIEMNAGK